MTIRSGAILMDVKFDEPSMLEKLQAEITDREIVDWADEKNRPTSLNGFDYAVCWKQDPGLLAAMPDLKLLFSAGAGVDHFLSGDPLPDVPLVRFVDQGLTDRMSEWVCLQCLMHLRRQRPYDAQQEKHIWNGLETQCRASDIRVGIMGMGVLGRDAANKLQVLGFQVNGWSRSKKLIAGVTSYDASETEAFLAGSDILIGLLPHTPQTEGIFNRDLFSKLARTSPLGGPIFMNAGRGRSQVEEDVIACLKEGILAGASLDVFEVEPLPSTSPLWDMANVIITPHMASTSDMAALGGLVARQIKRYENGEPLEHLVEMDRGY